ncbi:MAG: oxidoreductase [Nevskiales bacterium]
MADQWTSTDIPDLNGVTAVVTGANSGLGLHTTRGLAAAGGRVIMACRNQAKADTAADTIRTEYPQAELEVRSLDLSSLDSVQAFADGISKDKLTIHRLVNNAGIMAVPEGQTADGFEMQMGTNHLGHFALTGLLLGSLSDDARIINVSSMAHRWTPGINFDDLNWQSRRYKRWQAYGDSKLANLLFTFGLRDRLTKAGAKIITAAAHPGYSATHLQFVAAEQKQSRFEKWVMAAANAVVAQPAEMGALPSLYATTASDIESGDFIGPDGFQQIRGYPRKVGCRKQARSTELADQLWRTSEALTQTSYL